jgi:hypothetical protein
MELLNAWTLDGTMEHFTVELWEVVCHQKNRLLLSEKDIIGKFPPECLTISNPNF